MASNVLLNGLDLSDVTALASNVDSGKKFVDKNGDVITGTSNKIYTQAQYDAYGASQYNAGRTQGQSDVKSNPVSYSLYSAYEIVIRLETPVHHNYRDETDFSDYSLSPSVHTGDTSGSGDSQSLSVLYTDIKGNSRSAVFGQGTSYLLVKPNSSIYFNSLTITANQVNLYGSGTASVGLSGANQTCKQDGQVFTVSGSVNIIGGYLRGMGWTYYYIVQGSGGSVISNV